MLRAFVGRVDVRTLYNSIITASLTRTTGFVALGEVILNLFYLIFIVWLGIQYSNSTFPQQISSTNSI